MVWAFDDHRRVSPVPAARSNALQRVWQPGFFEQQPQMIKRGKRTLGLRPLTDWNSNDPLAAVVKLRPISRELTGVLLESLLISELHDDPQPALAE